MTDFDKGGKVSGAKTMPPRHVVAANNDGTNNDGVISQTVGELERQAAANQPNAAGGPGKEYGSSGISGRETHASYRKGS
jgi:hypothetical protein